MRTLSFAYQPSMKFIDIDSQILHIFDDTNVFITQILLPFALVKKLKNNKFYDQLHLYAN